MEDKPTDISGALALTVLGHITLVCYSLDYFYICVLFDSCFEYRDVNHKKEGAVVVMLQLLTLVMLSTTRLLLVLHILSW